MSNEFAHFRNTMTGEVVKLPRHYDGLFPTLELTEEDVQCTDCNTPDPEEVEQAEQPVGDSTDEPFLPDVETTSTSTSTLDITEPARRSRRSK